MKRNALIGLLVLAVVVLAIVAFRPSSDQPVAFRCDAPAEGTGADIEFRWRQDEFIDCQQGHVAKDENALDYVSLEGADLKTEYRCTYHMGASRASVECLPHEH